jgi:hypothetical protein
LGTFFLVAKYVKPIARPVAHAVANTRPPKRILVRGRPVLVRQGLVGGGQAHMHRTAPHPIITPQR